MGKSKDKKLSINSNKEKLSISNPEEVAAAQEHILQKAGGTEAYAEVENESQEEVLEADPEELEVETAVLEDAGAEKPPLPPSKIVPNKSGPQSSKIVAKTTVPEPVKGAAALRTSVQEPAKVVPKGAIPPKGADPPSPDPVVVNQPSNQALQNTGPEPVQPITSVITSTSKSQDNANVVVSSSPAVGPQVPTPAAQSVSKCASGTKRSRSKRCVSLKKAPWVVFINSKNPHLKHPTPNANSGSQRGDSLVDSRVYSRIAFELKGSRSSARNLAEWEASRRAKANNNILNHTNTRIDPGCGYQQKSEPKCAADPPSPCSEPVPKCEEAPAPECAKEN